MPELPKKKVGIIACSGEEIPEGTVTRLATLKVLEALRPKQTVTICLPLFLASGEGDRAFARFNPTITVDGCEKRCAARSTEIYSGQPAVSIVVRDSTPANSAELGSARRLSETGMHVVSNVANQIAQHVDELLDLNWDRRSGQPLRSSPAPEESIARQTTCSCGFAIPAQTLRISGREVTLIALPLIFSHFYATGKLPNDSTKADLMKAVKVYNPIPDEEEDAYATAIIEAYATFCRGDN